MTGIDHKHDWTLNLSKVGPDLVFCSCGAKFTPDNQQVPYFGIVPKRFL